MRVRHLALVGVAVVVVAGAWAVRWWSFFPLNGQIARSSGERSHAAGTPALQISASEIDFGAVPLGSVREASLLLTNVGTAPLRLVEIRTEGRFSLVRAPLLPARIGPGVGVRLNVAFAPAGPGAATDRLLIVSDAPSGVLSIPLRAVGMGMEKLVARFEEKPVTKPVGRLGSSAKRAPERELFTTEVRLPLPTADPGALPVARSLIELTSFLKAEDAGALQLISDEASLEVGGISKVDFRP
ncbi:MAG: hypothetical protein N0A16_09945 [Blastocatellia bacterium]|nr:hypothetical protein [Blastocatellia bacterium]MCS7158037.1 hypothetical protein [Blastocatellia bacterium]MCX7752544.1 hypothetical protein [Blastocatellia bacterium]MDW8167341.1 hypothetical protein [Acidobacteriota bacterium]MDW8257334.1 hypothetical protein [Acidobacteriota bacterium]